MSFRIKKSKTFRGKYEVRSRSGRLMDTNLTKAEANKSKTLFQKVERCVKKVKRLKNKVRSPHAVCRARIIGKKRKKRK